MSPGTSFGLPRPGELGVRPSNVDRHDRVRRHRARGRGGGKPADDAGNRRGRQDLGAFSVVNGQPNPILQAVSVGAVFMGANTYIGNGPNFMVKAIADKAGFKTPSFLGYMVYSGLILLPIFVVVTLVFF